MIIHATHKIYTMDDFTEAEYARRNKLAVCVIDNGRSICKKCGREGTELVTPCPRATVRFEVPYEIPAKEED